jgi:hypothetical protein
MQYKERKRRIKKTLDVQFTEVEKTKCIISHVTGQAIRNVRVLYDQILETPSGYVVCQLEALSLVTNSAYVYCTLTEVFLNLTEVFLTLTDVILCFFLGCKPNVRVKLAKTGHGPHSSTLVFICVIRLLFVLFYVLFVCKCVLPPGDNPIPVNKYIKYPT